MSLSDIDLSDLAFWARPIAERDEAFRVLRRQRPVAFFEERQTFLNSAINVPKGRGYYAVTRHPDVVWVSKHPDIYSSAQGIFVQDFPPVFLEFIGSMINMDDPRHARLRRIVSAAFSPRVMGDLEEAMHVEVDRLIDAVVDRGECEFVADIAAPLPLAIICRMMGIPDEERQFVFDRANVLIGGGDPEYIAEGVDAGVAVLTAAQELAELTERTAASRRQDPRPDVTTALINANVDGEALTQAELSSFFILLVVAGSETTRHAITHGLLALTERPQAAAAWRADFDRLSRTAVEEIIRWASPAMAMRRTVTEPTTLGDQRLEPGDKVVMYYNSANRDEEVFADPFEFDLARDPNPHLGFGGPGPHFCLGAHLARREIAVTFRHLLARLPDIRAVGQPEQLRSGTVNGVKRLRAEFTPGGEPR
ncbi:MAG TPA: cytochrome P450 [Acidimicrobiales bacterium]|nr:cytochrome P450 [Acidimicrobiales bacterium]